MEEPVEFKLRASLVFWLALATGVSVAAIYLSQLILKTLAQAMRSSVSQTGMIATLTQVGYGLGIFFLVPFGDILPQKKLALA